MANLTESPAASTPASQEHPMGREAPVPRCGQGSVPVLYSSPAPGQVAGVPVCIQTLTAADGRSAILHMDRFTQGYIYIK